MSNSRVRFCSLNQKFVDNDDQIPEQAQEVMYYSLAIGHHVGVIDCLKTVLECSLDDYKNWIGKLPTGDAKRKFEGLLRFGEITIDSSHVQLLAQELNRSRPLFEPQELEWTDTLMRTLHSIESEPAIYLMVRRIDD